MISFCLVIILWIFIMIIRSWVKLIKC
jgi:hypothetical protein